jgi:hypothetical protein
MKDLIEKLLKSLGLDAETIKAFVDEDAEERLEPAALKEKITGVYKEVLSNDPAFTKTFKDQQRAEVLSSKENKIKKLFGDFLDSDKLDALPEKDKFDAMLKLLDAGVTAKIEELDDKASGGDDKSKKAIEELKEEVKTLRQNLSEKDGEIAKAQEAVETAKNEAKTTLSKHAKEEALKRELRKHKLIIDEGLAFGVVVASMEKKYNLRFDEETEEFKVLKKGTEEVEAFDDNNNKVTLSGLMKNTLEEGKLLKKSNAGEGGGTGGGASDDDDDGDKGPKYKLPGQRKAKESIEAKKKSLKEAE